MSLVSFVLICITLFCKNTRTFQRIKSCHYFLIIRLLRLHQRSVVIFMHNINFRLDLFPSAADALFADFADVHPFTVYIFWYLHENKFPMPTVFCITLHNRLCCCGSTRKEIQDNIIGFC